MDKKQNPILSEKKCVSCEGGVLPLAGIEVEKYLAQLTTKWFVVEDNPSTQLGARKIIKEFKFKDFKEAMAFVNRVAEVAEAEGHHPDLHIFYNKVTVELWTHAIGGLSENDFILAAKIEKLT